MPAQTADPTELRDIAESILTARQYEIWLLHLEGYQAWRIAQIMRLSRPTIERELHAIRLACREHAATKREGPVSLHVTTQTETDSFNREGEGINPAHKSDTVAASAHRTLLRFLSRRQAAST